jgi:hypothetical protein
MAIEVKHYKVRQLPSSPTPNSIYWVKASTDSEVSGYITDLQGVPYPLKDISGSGGIQSIVNSDGNITVTGSDNLVINISPALLSVINSALQSGNNISELFNDAGYITSSSLPTNTSELINDGADGTSTYVEQDDVDLLLQVKQDLPTGFITGLALSIKVGDPTKAIIGTGAYAVSDFSDLNNIQVNIIQVTTPIEFTPQYLNTNPASYIALDINQNVIQSSSPFDNDDRRTLALIGATIHSNLTIINVVNEIKAPIVAPTNQLHDLIRAVGSLNLEGNVYYPNGANLQINKTAGQIWGLGINSQNYLDPHRLTIPAQTGLTFRYRLRDTSLPNGESADTNLIDPDHYDNGGVKTTVPNNRFTIQRINLFQSGLTRIQYGQTVYQNLDEAKILVQTETFETEMNIADNAIFRAYLIIKKGVTDLTTAVANGDADFIPVDKFGNVIGGAGIVLNFSNITTGLGYVPEDVANKATDFSIINDTLYPSVEAVQEQLDLKLDKSSTPSSVYATDEDGEQVMKPLSELAGSYTVIGKNVVDSSPVTSTTANTTVETFVIPANTFQVGDVILFRQRNLKTGTAGALSSRSVIASWGFNGINQSATNLYGQYERTLVVKSNTDTQELNTFTFTSNIQTAGAVSYNIDWSLDQNLLIRLQLANASDSAIVSYWELSRIR